jgi:hypothetical protein
VCASCPLSLHYNVDQDPGPSQSEVYTALASRDLVQQMPSGAIDVIVEGMQLENAW